MADMVKQSTPSNQTSAIEDAEDQRPTAIEYREEVKPDPAALGHDTVCLTKQIGMFSGATIIVGNIVGSGIFLTPGGVLKNTGSVGMSMIVWIVSGLFSLIGALCFAELGTTITESGAEYSYIKEAFGDSAAFLVLWVSLIIIVPTGNMLVALVFGSYIIQPFYPDPECPPPDVFVRIMAVLCIDFSLKNFPGASTSIVSRSLANKVKELNTVLV